MNKLIILLLSALLFHSCGNKQPRQSQQKPLPEKFVSFWDGFNFHDKAMIHNPGITEPRFKDFLTLLQTQNPDAARQQIDTLLQRAQEGSQEMFLDIMDMAEKYLADPNSSYRNEETYLSFLQFALANTALDEAYKDRYRYQVTNIQKNRVGTRALDIKFITAQGAPGTLRQITTPRILIYFNNPDCHDCKRVLQILTSSPTISHLVATDSLTVLALYPDDDLRIWRAHLPDFPSSWLVARYAPDTDKSAYPLPAIPALYLLGPRHQVLLKDAPVEQVLQTLAPSA